jgi:hypothetical protein
MNRVSSRPLRQILHVVVVVAVAVAGLLSGRLPAQTEVQFPADAGVFNVKTYGATGNGTTDDTVAFQAAIKAAIDSPVNHYGGMAILYVPTGTYLLSNTLQNRDGGSFSDGWIAGMYLQGQSQAGTILKLQNSCPGFTSASSPKAVIQTGSENPYTNTAKTVTSLTSSGKTATVVCPANGFTNGQIIDIKGALPTGYNELYAPITVVNTNTFTYALSGTLTSPATGTITAASYQAGDGDQAFRHYIRNLTIDVGTGNPGAVGVDFLTNNRGGLYNVTIKSSDTGYVGYTGLMMDRSYPGPGIIKNVTVTGFTTGISMRSAAEYSMTFDNITLSHQLSYGIDNHTNTMSIDGLTSSNTVPVIYSETTGTHLVLINGTFTGGTSTVNAITGSGSWYCRNVKSTGYGDVINNANGNIVAGNGGTAVTVPEYESTATYKGFSTNISGSMQIPIEETPDFSDITLTDWQNATTGTVTGGDYLASIQAAIDSGKPVVYLPHGVYAVSNSIHLRGSVQKFIGCCAEINKTSSFPANTPILVFDGGAVPYTDVQNIRFGGGIEHNSDDDLAFENCDIGAYVNTAAGSGALFLEDVIAGDKTASGNQGIELAQPQYAWVRQLDLEGVTSASFTNSASAAWIFGFKTENQSTTGSIILNENGGWTELLGGFFYVDTGTLAAPSVPMIVNNNSQLSANYMMDAYESKNFPESIQDIEGTTYNFSNNNCTLYSGSPTVFPVPVALANYAFASSTVSTDTDANSTASNFLAGSGYTDTVLTAGHQDQVVGPGVANDTAAQDYAAGQYFHFSITPNTGKLLDLSALNITVQRSQSSPPACTVYAVPTGGPANGQLLLVLDNVVVNGNTNTAYIGDLTGAEYQGISGVNFYVIFDGANQGSTSAKDDIGPVSVTGMAQ